MTSKRPPELNASASPLSRLRYLQRPETMDDTRTRSHIVEMIEDNPTEALLWESWLAIASEELSKAEKTLARALAEQPDTAELHYLSAMVANKIGDPQKAKQAAQRACVLQPDFAECHVILCRMRLKAPVYPTVLKRIHETVKPETYLEIGVFQGATLKLAKDAKSAVGVDPDPKLSDQLPRQFEILTMPSDAFFSDHAEARYGGKPIDFAFVDGLHEAKQALRDVLNTERFSHCEATIAMHDIIPLDAATSTPQQETLFWSGDVWKTWMALRKFCPDLFFLSIDAPPTGLGLIRKLNPERAVSDSQLQDMYAYMDTLEFDTVARTPGWVKALGRETWQQSALTEFMET